MGTNVKLLLVSGCVLLVAGICAGQEGPGIQIRSVAHATSAPLSSFPPLPPGWRSGIPPRVFLVLPAKSPGAGGVGGAGVGCSSSKRHLQQHATSAQFALRYAFPVPRLTDAV